MAASTLNSNVLKPVYECYFADPFLWQHQGTYYAIGTGALESSGRTSGKIFPLLQSADFQQWLPVGEAMVPPDPALGDTFWAPAIAHAEGVFYLYYSVGQGDRGHQMRVAASSAPTGPYEDLGTTLLDPQLTPFAIDPHPFQDVDGKWYFLYACDLLDNKDSARAGTALVIRRMRTMTQLEDSGSVVLRARSDWQRFQASRPIYGSVWDWHTLEGPCLVRHDGCYYCFYSGGRWENESYGVDYGIAQSPLGTYTDVGNEQGPRVLRTKPGGLIGPGHNSYIIGPDGAEYLAFHAWDQAMTARRMFFQRLVWTSDGPRCSHG
jgi:beta-xylosidase